MLSHALRIGVLLAAVLAAAASASRQPSAPPPPATAGAAPQTPSRGYYCHTEQSPSMAASMCRPAYDACESERQAAAADGLSVTPCTVAYAVACFQLGGDPAPAAAWCAATLEDCEAWRRLDLERNPGLPSGPCAWKQ